MGINVASRTSGVVSRYPIFIVLRQTVVLYISGIHKRFVNTKFDQKACENKYSIGSIIKVVSTCTCTCSSKYDIIRTQNI